jgi:hypothetical protein
LLFDPTPAFSLAEVAGLVRRVVRSCAACPAGIISPAAYDVNAPFMQLEQHGWDIHAV